MYSVLAELVPVVESDLCKLAVEHDSVAFDSHQLVLEHAVGQGLLLGL